MCQTPQTQTIQQSSKEVKGGRSSLCQGVRGGLTRWWALRIHNAEGVYKGSSWLNSTAWFLWLCSVAYLMILPVATHMLQLAVLFTVLILLSSAIPIDGSSVLPYFIPLIMVPTFIIKATLLPGLWTFSPLVILYVVFPLFDFFVGVNLGSHSADQLDEVQDALKFRLVTFAAVPEMLACLAYGAWLTSAETRTIAEFFGISISFGLLSGIVGIVVGHEMVHRVSKVEKLAGRFLLCLVSYGHFYVEHVVGHHKHVATDADPASARYGESLYAFIPRVIVGEFRSACRIEAERVARKGLPFWRCEIPLYGLCSTLVCGSFMWAFGKQALVYFLIQSFIAIMLFQSVHYQSHYGLERREIRLGVHEPTQPQHSWEAPSRLVNMIILNLTRHPDHHAHAGRRYQALQLLEGSPQSPAGLPTMMALAMIPPLWRAVVHPRLLEFRKTQVDQTFRHGPTPAQ
eukprot:TRINITY_DN3451_c0_g1_i1.p1 TRINITY_DN3451_c0_g1~~TRINITY_DN3451_c0_g1_i1.p1  ORF type:complete len:458 (+),score=49.73 TRINITY_DN3451_c0_g1_i1:244-1617(+)